MYPEAKLNHKLLVSKCQIMLKRQKKKKWRKQLNINKLKTPEIEKKFQAKLKNNENKK